jgi:hypothetical protein
MFAALDKRASEADAEQKVAYPLLTNPIYLAIPDPSVKGKQYLRSSPLEKKSGFRFRLYS